MWIVKATVLLLVIRLSTCHKTDYKMNELLSIVITFDIREIYKCTVFYCRCWRIV